MYSSFDTPGEFFNASPTTSGYSVGAESITLGCGDHTTPANRFLTNLTDEQANASTGSTAQVIFGIFDAIYQRFNSIAQADRPEKFSIFRSGFTDEETGETVFTYTATIRVVTSSYTAMNS